MVLCRGCGKTEERAAAVESGASSLKNEIMRTNALLRMELQESRIAQMPAPPVTSTGYATSFVHDIPGVAELTSSYYAQRAHLLTCRNLMMDSGLFCVLMPSNFLRPLVTLLFCSSFPNFMPYHTNCVFIWICATFYNEQKSDWGQPRADGGHWHAVSAAFSLIFQS